MQNTVFSCWFAVCTEILRPSEAQFSIKMESDIETREADPLLLTDTCEIGGEMSAFLSYLMIRDFAF